MTDKIILELTLDELKLIDKHIEYNKETKSVFDKIKYAYPQLKMTLKQEGDYVVVSYNDTTYYRLMGKTTFCWYIKKGVSANYHTPTLVMVIDGETERLLEGLYYNDIVVKKEKEQQLKSSAEECYKEWWGEYPTNTWQNDVTRWEAFQAGYNAAYKQKAQEPEEQVSFVPKEIKELVEEGVKWCEDHPNKNPLDWLTPKTPEETAESLREAFVKAQQTEKWKELQRKIDEEDNDKNFKNSLDIIKEWGEKNKPPTLYQLIEDWWCDVFCANSTDDMETCIDGLVDKIDREFIPPSSEKNGHVWEKCLKIMRDKLR